MVQSACILEKTILSHRNARGGFSSGFIFLGSYQKKKKGRLPSMEKSSIDFFFSLIQQSEKFSFCSSQSKLSSSRNLMGKKIVFLLVFYLKFHFQTKKIMQTLSSAFYLVIMVWFANRKHVSDITQRGFTDWPYFPFVGDPSGDCNILFNLNCMLESGHHY